MRTLVIGSLVVFAALNFPMFASAQSDTETARAIDSLRETIESQHFQDQLDREEEARRARPPDALPGELARGLEDYKRRSSDQPGLVYKPASTQEDLDETRASIDWALKSLHEHPH